MVIIEESNLYEIWTIDLNVSKLSANSVAS
jgi:hypothetical protein